MGSITDPTVTGHAPHLRKTEVARGSRLATCSTMAALNVAYAENVHAHEPRWPTMHRNMPALIVGCSMSVMAAAGV